MDLRLLSLTDQMLFIRMFEEEIARRYLEQEMRCPVHLSLGQEACAVGVASQLSYQDFMVSTHRSHAHYLAKGGDPYKLLCELYGKADGCSRGQGGSMHLVDWSKGFAGSTSIVGGTIPIGVGLAFASKLQSQKRITAVCIGDAAIEEGVFHESANFASLHKLPVIFVVENNLYSCYTYLKDRQPMRSFEKIAHAHNISYNKVDGNDVDLVSETMATIASEMNYRQQPWFLELKTYRLIEHCGPNQDDDLNYRPTQERLSFKDPVGMDRPKEIEKSINELFARAKRAPFPDQSELGKYTYA